MGDHGLVPAIPYFVLTFAWTWSWWWSAAALDPLPGPLMFAAGGFGPLVGAVWTVGQRDRAYGRDFVRRVWDPRGIGAPWWLGLVAVAAGPAVLGAGVARLAGAAATAPSYTLGMVAGVLGFAIAAGLVEEPGWRGAALDAWQVRTRPVFAALGIGAFWAVWHLPLYFIEGTYQNGLGFGTPRFWLTNLVLVGLAVLYVWLVNGAGGSILVAILAHAGFNVAGELVPRSTMGDVVAFAIVAVASVLVVVATRGELSFAGARPPGRRADRSA